MIFTVLISCSIIVLGSSLCIIVYGKLIMNINKCSKHLVGKVVIVTGGNAGIGFETAKDMAERGARVYIACRNEGRGIAARDKIIAASGNQEVHYRHLDLASLNSVRNFVNEFIKTENRLDILINNAAVLDSEHVKTEDGLLFAMQTNYFGPFLLTNLLLPILKSSAPSRIINVSSLAYKTGEIDFNNLNMEKETKESYNFVKVYANTKLCNILMTVELKRRLEGTGVTANCLHPGLVRTAALNEIERPWVKYIYSPIAKYFSKTAWEGAQTSIYLAVSPEVNDINGCYFENCKLSKTSKKARDTIVAQKLWEVSEKLVGL